MILLSKNCRVPVENLAQVFDCKEYVADASNSLWKIEQWKEACKTLHLRFHSVPEQGAFITDL